MNPCFLFASLNIILLYTTITCIPHIFLSQKYFFQIIVIMFKSSQTQSMIVFFLVLMVAIFSSTLGEEDKIIPLARRGYRSKPSPSSPSKFLWVVSLIFTIYWILSFKNSLDYYSDKVKEAKGGVQVSQVRVNHITENLHQVSQAQVSQVRVNRITENLHQASQSLHHQSQSQRHQSRVPRNLTTTDPIGPTTTDLFIDQFIDLFEITFECLFHHPVLHLLYCPPPSTTGNISWF